LNSSIRQHDEAVLRYFGNLLIDDGENRRPPQTVFAIPSFQGSKLQVSESWTPIFPLIVVTRTGIEKVPATNIIKGRKYRPAVTYLNEDTKTMSQAEIMPYNINYKIDVISLFMEQNLQILESIIWKLEKSPGVLVNIPANTLNIQVSAYISNYTVSDSTNYENIPDEENRIIKNTITLSLFSYFVDTRYGAKTVLKTINNLKLDKN